MNFFRLIFPCPNIVFVLHPLPPPPISFLMVRPRVFSHDVTAAILLSQNNETADMLMSQTNPVGVELFSYARKKHSIRVKVRTHGQQKTCNLFCNIGIAMLRVLPPMFKPVNNLICCKTGFKARNIAIQLVLQQCCKTSCTFFCCPFFRTFRYSKAFTVSCIVTVLSRSSQFVFENTLTE